MTELAQDDRQMQAYSDAVRSGLYAKQSGLTGKYDNVRRYWEDEITRQFLRPAIVKLLERSRRLMRRLRIMDLGCGSADGWELLEGVRDRRADLCRREVDLLAPQTVGLYTGVDLNADLLAQARELYGNNPKMQFVQGDFTEGLPLGDDEPPYDLYFTSYGTCSHHLDDATMVRMLAQVAERTEDYSVVVCDWIGRYSYEWQELWTDNPAERPDMDYVVSYIYPPEEREARRAELQHLTLRLMSRGEAEAVIDEASREAGTAIRPLAFFDRSVFTGRHMCTGEYNRHAQPIRDAVNSLHEVNQRTDLDSLIIDYVPRPGFDLLNDYFEHLQVSWNALVRYADDLLGRYDPEEGRFRDAPPPVPASYPEPLRKAMERVRRIVEGVGWLDVGLPRENIIEPQLGYALRYLVSSLQQGRGAAHGLVAVLEIDKRRPAGD